MTFKLVIKAPNQKIDDQIIEGCNDDWSVKRLKEHLSEIYPNKPEPKDQRLIYSGHLLRDEQILKDIFETHSQSASSSSEPSYTLHLVVSQKMSQSQRDSQANSSTNSSTSNSSNGEIPTVNGVTPNQNGVHPQASPNISIPFQTEGPNVVSWSLPNISIYAGYPAAPTTANLSAEQMWQQFAIAQQLYAQYMTQYLTQVGAQPQAFLPTAPLIHPIVNAAPIIAADPNIGVVGDQALPNINIPVAPIPPQAVAPEARPAPVPMQRMNAGPGPAPPDDEEAIQRDWLDWVYYASRALILLSVVYFYSSFSRFMIVVGIGMLLYFYQNQRNARRRAEQLDARIRQRHLQQQQQQRQAEERSDGNSEGDEAARLNDPQNDANQVEDIMDGDSENVLRRRQNVRARAGDNQNIENRPGEGNRNHPEDLAFTENARHQVEQDDGPVSPIRFVWIFVSSLFSSLIPDQPAPVNIN